MYLAIAKHLFTFFLQVNAVTFGEGSALHLACEVLTDEDEDFVAYLLEVHFSLLSPCTSVSFDFSIELK